MNSVRTLLLILLICGIASAGQVISLRHHAEVANSTVEIAIDMDEVQSLAASQGMASIERLLMELKAAGVTSVAVTETTMADLMSCGMVRVSSSPMTIVSDSRAIQASLNRTLVALGIARVSRAGDTVVFSLPPTELAKIPVGFGFDSPGIFHARRAGMSLIARAYNYPEANEESLQVLSEELDKLNTKKVIFAGDEILGWPGGVEDTAVALRAARLTFGSIEFAKQKGGEKLEELLRGGYVRVHSISSSEMANYQPAAAVERFVRAARERNVRVLYIHLLATNGPDAVKLNTDYIADIVSGLNKSGLKIGSAEISADPMPRKWQLIVMAVAVACALLLALTELFCLSISSAVGLLLLSGILLTAAVFAGDLGRKVIALASALIFPVWALLRAARLSEADSNEKNAGWLKLLAHYVAAVLISVFGGMIIAATLSGRLFMTETDQFSGVKLAHLLPIFIIAFTAVAGTLGRPWPWREFWRRTSESFRGIWKSPVLFSYAIIGLLGLITLLVVVLRSGNDAGVGVSPIELRFRALLDQILFVRPRTKEIFVGYPGLWAAVWLAQGKNKAWSGFFMVAGAVGLVSAVNTFCHIHTPLAISFLRVINGAWVGAIFGIILIALLKRMGLRRQGSVK